MSASSRGLSPDTNGMAKQAAGYSCGFWIGRFWLTHVGTPFGPLQLSQPDGESALEQPAVQTQIYFILRGAYCHELAEAMKKKG